MPEIEKRYIEAPVYSSNLYRLSNGEEYTVCEKCQEPNNLSKTDGFCSSCKNGLGDSQGDLASPEVVEEMMFSYMEHISKRIEKLDDIIKSLVLGKEIDLNEYISIAKSHIGEGHKSFKKENGHLISSYLKREQIEVLNESFEKVSWIQGTIVSPEIFEKVKNGLYKSYSFGAKGLRIKLNELKDLDND